jgi:hypothetical protein
VARLPGKGGEQETAPVTDNNRRVSQFKLDGTFIRIFAGTGSEGSDDGELSSPCGITVLGSSVFDTNDYRVQIFDREGNYKRQFGNEGKEADGQFYLPSALASDAHGNLLVLDLTNRLQVFNTKGKHLCTRNDLGLEDGSIKDIAWSDIGEFAIADDSLNQALIWRSEYRYNKGLKHMIVAPASLIWRNEYQEGGFACAQVSAARKWEHCQKGVACVPRVVVLLSCC